MVGSDEDGHPLADEVRLPTVKEQGYNKRRSPPPLERPEIIPPDTERNHCIQMALQTLWDSVIFGLIVSGTIFLAFAFYNAICDPFEYFNIFWVGALVYLFFAVLVYIISYFLGELSGRFTRYGTASSNASSTTMSGSSTTDSYRSSDASETFDNQSMREAIASGMDAARGRTTTGESVTYESDAEPENQRQNSSRRSPVDNLSELCRQNPCCIPPEAISLVEDEDENETDDCINRQVQGPPLIPSNYAECMARSLRINAPRPCSPGPGPAQTQTQTTAPTRRPKTCLTQQSPQPRQSTPRGRTNNNPTSSRTCPTTTTPPQNPTCRPAEFAYFRAEGYD